jgi:hypothetical protein
MRQQGNPRRVALEVDHCVVHGSPSDPWITIRYEPNALQAPD